MSGIVGIRRSDIDVKHQTTSLSRQLLTNQPQRARVARFQWLPPRLGSELSALDRDAARLRLSGVDWVAALRSIGLDEMSFNMHIQRVFHQLLKSSLVAARCMLG